MRLRLLLPFITLLLAALACDESYGISYNTIFVEAIAADTNQPGSARIHVREMVGSVSGDDTSSLRVTDTYFSTTDYGLTWTPLPEPFEPPESALPLAWWGGTLFYDEQPLWSYPRANFREFFYTQANASFEISPTITTFELDMGEAHNAIAGDVIYISLGTEGMLVGPAPGSSTERPWTIQQNIPGLRALPLRFTDPLAVVGVILMALLLPPLPLIHAYLLSRVWRYFMPVRTAWRLAWRLSLWFAWVAGAGIAIWIVPLTFDIGYVPLVVGVGSIVIVTGTAITVLHARDAGFSARRQWQAGITALFVSAIVPVGVLAIWMAWWAISLLLGGYIGMAWLSRYALRRNGLVTDLPTPLMHWRVDRIAMDSTVLTGSMVFLAWLLVSFYVGRTRSALELPVTIGLFILAVVMLRERINRYVRLLHHNAGIAQPFRALSWLSPAIGLGVWLIIAACATTVTFIGQAYAAGWFTDWLS